MKIYIAGFGHKIQKSKSFSKKMEKEGCFLLSYFYIRDKQTKERFEWIKQAKEKA